jgi:uncharacterized membrane protein
MMMLSCSSPATICTSNSGPSCTIATGIASIGGAGTFDGIVLSGIVAAYLA